MSITWLSVSVMRNLKMKIIVLCCLGALALLAVAEETEGNYAGVSRGTSTGCKPDTCNAECHRRGKSAGGCIGKKCHCTPRFFDLTSVYPVPNLSEETVLIEGSLPRACWPPSCTHECRKKGKSAGNCLGKKCVCSPKFYVFTEASDDRFSTLSEETVLTAGTRTGCKPNTCNAECHRRGKSAGGCIGKKCHCTPRFFDLTEASDETVPNFFEEAALKRNLLSRSCWPPSCMHECRKKGKSAGNCLGKKCVCSAKFYDIADASNDRVPNLSEDTGFDAVAEKIDCIDAVCNYQCQAKGFRGGRCVGTSKKKTCECARRKFI